MVQRAGVEALGFAGPDVDAEIILAGQRLWDCLQLQGLRLELNTLGQLDERAAHRAALADYLKRHIELLDEDAKRRLEPTRCAFLIPRTLRYKTSCAARLDCWIFWARRRARILRRCAGFCRQTVFLSPSTRGWCAGWTITISRFLNGLQTGLARKAASRAAAVTIG